jgi:hypothetical protein
VPGPSAASSRVFATATFSIPSGSDWSQGFVECPSGVVVGGGFSAQAVGGGSTNKEDQIRIMESFPSIGLNGYFVAVRSETGLIGGEDLEGKVWAICLAY